MTELYQVTQLAMEILPLVLIALLISAVVMLAYEIYQQKQPKVTKIATTSTNVVQPKPVTVPSQLIAITQQPSVAVPPKTTLPPQIPVGIPTPPLTVPSVAANPPLTPWTTTVSHNKQTRALFGQLVRLLQGDSSAANRLLTHQRTKHPEKSEEWILEKVIDDLKRDQH
ncbi:MAG: hypothetical protein SAK29_25240 [Scytonema sp. PMC 1069.18]|nr:hypothetical protein [Scytonema sp. PMC 1069.18]MEC4881164.1 hypothetical protein [Scytonema sp. PMC 1070.18]